MGLSQVEIRQRVLSHPLFDVQENERIYQKYFTRPTRTTQVLIKHYGLDQRRVLEIGSAYGYDLIRFGEGSAGVDVRQIFQDYGQGLGLDIRIANVEESFPAFPEPFDALLCANLLEHIVAPHLFLMRLRQLLTPNGLLCIKVPLTPPDWLWRLYQFVGREHGFENAQHINFFTLSALRWTVERAGYRTLQQCSPGLASHPILKWADPILNTWMPSTLIVAEKIEDFYYHPERIAEYNPPYAPDLLPYYKT